MPHGGGIAGASTTGFTGNANSTGGSSPNSAASSMPQSPLMAPKAPLTPVSIDLTGNDNPAGLTPAEVTALAAGGPPGDMRWLYPYEGTVFPRGMLSPILMWNSDPAADAVYLHVQSTLFDFKAALKPTADGAVLNPISFGAAVASSWSQQLTSLGLEPTGKQLLIPQDVWDRAGQQTLGRDDTFTLELIERARGTIRGPIRLHIQIAQSDIKGSIYYSTCMSNMQGAGNTGLASMLVGNGKLLRIRSGGTAELLLSKPGENDTRCQGCHSVSANGTRLLAQRSVTTDPDQLVNFFAGDDDSGGWSYQFNPDGSVKLLEGLAAGPLGAYGALYPDGSKYLATAVPPSTLAAPDTLLWLMGYVRPFQTAANPPQFLPATLYDASTGTVVSDTGIPSGALMPTFSPDGTRLVFNDLDLAAARGLAVMDYETQKHRASNYKELMRERSDGAMRPGWPFFLPDNKAVVFVRTETPTFSSLQFFSPNSVATRVMANDPNSPPAAPSDLYIADVATGQVTLLAKAMGFNSLADADSGKTYLPFGAIDTHHNYFPTVSQVASGGYFWVFFDSWRHYGNLGLRRELWGFAIDIRPDGYTTDPSHPPFYLPGQEFGIGNKHRAFIALDPCKPAGAACTSAVTCCEGTTCEFDGGMSTVQRGLPVGTCAPPPPPTDPPVCATCASCAKLDERCATSADCCDSSHYCINGFCAFVPLL